MKSRLFNIRNSISSSLKVGLGWFKILWKEEKKISNFVVEHFSQFLSLLREKGEKKLKIHLVSDAIKSDLSSVFRPYLELQNSNWGVLVALESLFKDLQLLFLSPRANSNYCYRYRAWKCVKEVSVVRQACYSATIAL